VPDLGLDIGKLWCQYHDIVRPRLLRGFNKLSAFDIEWQGERRLLNLW